MSTRNQNESHQGMMTRLAHRKTSMPSQRNRQPLLTRRQSPQQLPLVRQLKRLQSVKRRRRERLRQLRVRWSITNQLRRMRLTDRQPLGLKSRSNRRQSSENCLARQTKSQAKYRVSDRSIAHHLDRDYDRARWCAIERMHAHKRACDLARMNVRADTGLTLQILTTMRKS